MVLVFVIATSAHSVIATFNEIHFKKMVMKIKNFQILIHYMSHKNCSSNKCSTFLSWKIPNSGFFAFNKFDISSDQIFKSAINYGPYWTWHFLISSAHTAKWYIGWKILHVYYQYIKSSESLTEGVAFVFYFLFFFDFFLFTFCFGHGGGIGFGNFYRDKNYGIEIQ